MDRPSAAAVTLSCLLASCNDADPLKLQPSPLVVDRIEAQLVGRPCIGALERWERHYSYGHGGDPGSPDRGVERNRIFFDFNEAGIYHYRSRRIISAHGSGLDERQMRFAFGEYDVPSGRITIHHCGWNHEPDIETR